MKKDVIYIDIEDDITSVIDKINSSKEKIIALVPPKGSAVLQSVVNLKLLRRAAEKQSKRTVIVTSNAALTSLAGGAGIYVAKTLQSKPEIPSGEDFDTPIDGPVELSDDVGSIVTHKADDIDDEVEISGEDIDLSSGVEEKPKKEPKASKASAKKPTDKKKKVPNFSSFRKKALLIGGGLILLLIILIAVFGRTKSDIVIRAETTPIDVQFDATVNVSGETSSAQKTLKAQKQETKKNVSQEFTATGEKDIGKKATGTVEFSNGTFAAKSVPSGTKLETNDGLIFVTNGDVSIPAASFPCGNIYCASPGEGSVGVTATDSGESYNGASGSVSGSPSGINAKFDGSTSGGTTKMVKVVSQADVDRARKALEGDRDEAAVKKELTDGFDGKVKILDDSFTVKLGDIKSEPAVGQEASSARLTASITYTMLAVSEEDLSSLLDEAIMAEVPNKEQQRVYQNGLDDVSFRKKSGSGDKITYQIGSVGRYGPRFDVDSLKDQITGRKVGEVRSILQDLPGVNGVDIHLSPFWARSMPNTGRIEIKLDVDESAN